MDKNVQKAVRRLEEVTGLDLSWGEPLFDEPSSTMTVAGYVTKDIYISTYVCYVQHGDTVTDATSNEVLELLKSK